MAKIGKVQEVAIAELKPYANNAKIHGEDQLEKLRASIREFGFISPCLIDGEKNIIAGHGRVMAAEQLGMKKVPCVYVEGLTEEQRRAYIIADNRLGDLAEWNIDIVFEELADLDALDFNIDLTGFNLPEQRADWFEQRERFDMSREEGNDEYNEFLDKFEQPKTTDDCYTPDNVYEVVAEYVANKYGVSREDFVRPFYPGGDYQNERYKDGAVVVDNPPFSIMAEIVDWYTEHGIRFFLFAPGLSVLGYAGRKNVTALCVYAGITYENGACVLTSFVTNLEKEDVVAITDPDLWQQIEEANEENEEKMHVHLPKYDYPDEVATSAKLGWLSPTAVDALCRGC